MDLTPIPPTAAGQAHEAFKKLHEERPATPPCCLPACPAAEGEHLTRRVAKAVDRLFASLAGVGPGRGRSLGDGLATRKNMWHKRHKKKTQAKKKQNECKFSRQPRTTETPLSAVSLNFCRFLLKPKFRSSLCQILA